MKSIADVLLAEHRLRRRRLIVIACVFLIGLAAIAATAPTTNIGPVEALRVITVLGIEMLPPDFSRISLWLPELGVTILIAIAGTTLATLVSAPLALLAANVSRQAGGARAPSVTYHATRWILAALRSVPELIWGVLLVAAFGFGPFPGVLALALHSIGMMGKFFAETIEHSSNDAAVQYANATGASRGAIFTHVVLPIVLPRWLDVILYRWEHNIRASTMLGLVGAGGIGLEFMTAMKIFDYRTASAILIAVFFAVIVCETIGAKIRSLIR